MLSYLELLFLTLIFIFILFLVYTLSYSFHEIILHQDFNSIKSLVSKYGVFSGMKEIGEISNSLNLDEDKKVKEDERNKKIMKMDKTNEQLEVSESLEEKDRNQYTFQTGSEVYRSSFYYILSLSLFAFFIIFFILSYSPFSIPLFYYMCLFFFIFLSFFLIWYLHELYHKEHSWPEQVPIVNYFYLKLKAKHTSYHNK